MAIRTVVSLGIEDRMADKYRENLKEAEQAALRASVWVALGELADSCDSKFVCSTLERSGCIGVYVLSFPKSWLMRCRVGRANGVDVLYERSRLVVRWEAFGR